ncbi:lysine 2,3-aminomutase YodO family protein [Methylocella silvestris BL2]|uniref:Lysine 2,3-aminomutase YodO family protein n=1 Tax=Methylocella silvestris (strain DSM 15510 / CIP 108128 / LMG 27833 / NCIMB 13906 / BL2) TaxID=395965 RepID=B8EJM3_METSB|nr:lysine-2,3-aminomutase-like protein [Methylocella silvestris]ACK49427.1 lysine 2,3-aminomutase YodO family protein [Methylocella silvestris BL2]
MIATAKSLRAKSLRAKTLRSADDLVEAGLASARRRAEIESVGETYPIAVTPAIAALIDRDAPNDPIARQFVPDIAELSPRPEDLADPIGDEAYSPVEGVVHRYPDRVLLKLLLVCPVYCRFCFRRDMVGPGKSAHLSPEALDAALAYIAADPRIWEVILTGGDPFALSPRRLAEIMERLAAIEHVRIVRVHTRVPCVDPDAIDAALIAALKKSGKTIYVALHANHPRELTSEARAACARLIDAGIPMVSQSVLLAGVNDDVETLSALMRGFVEARVKPYYLHHLDLAPGVAHFRVDIEKGRELMQQLRGRLSGLCQPAYMLDVPGGHGKSPIGPDFIEPAGANGVFRVRDYQGATHLYPPQVP